MDQTTLGDLEYQVRHRQLDFLRASGLNLDVSDPNDTRTTCPMCSRIAHIYEVPAGLNMPTWECEFCGQKGNAIDYAMNYYGFSRTQAIYDVCRKLKIRITKLDTITAASLMEKQFSPQDELIEGLLAPGLYILAGASKIGKSWLVLQIAHHVSMGIPLWERKTQKSEVLYLALEDTERRLQKRLMRICNGETGDISFATEAEILEHGFEEQVIDYLQKHPDAKLVIVDTMIKVRDTGGYGNAYAEDYSTMNCFKRLTTRFSIVLLLVHHTRKQEARDIMDMISGTTGIMGCADGAMVLERPVRGAPQAIISTTGRDFEDMKINLVQNSETMCWEFAGYADAVSEEELDPLLIAVAQLVEQEGFWKGTAEQLLQKLLEISPRLNLKPNTLARRLNVQIQELKELYSIRYSRQRSAEGKFVILEPIEEVSDISDMTDM